MQQYNLDKMRAVWRVQNNIHHDSVATSLSIVNRADQVEINIFDIIGVNDTDVSSFIESVNAASGKPINLNINSPGGFYFDALTMYDVLNTSKSTVNVSIRALAASAATVIAMAGDSVTIAESGRMMIHDVQGLVGGSPAEIREYADLTDNLSNDLSKIYAKRGKHSAVAFRNAMKKETWYSSQQAVDVGLVDRVSSKGNKGPDNRTRIIQARYSALMGGLK